VKLYESVCEGEEGSIRDGEGGRRHGTLPVEASTSAPTHTLSFSSYHCLKLCQRFSSLGEVALAVVALVAGRG